ncbi:MAG TPA: dephospho-CoA kinase, partial [Microbacterium sp.]|nr:dephospho-CoA kinase [Microbacterium sp.]
EARIRRMVDDRGMTEEDAAARVRNQASDEERLAMADIVIDTGGTLEHTLEQADRLWDQLSSRVAAA